MSDLEALAQRVESLSEELRHSRPARQEVEKVSGWLRDLLEEADAFRQLPLWHPQRIRKGSRLLRQGESATTREIRKRFGKWDADRSNHPKAEEDSTKLKKDLQRTIQEKAATSREAGWKRALGEAAEPVERDLSQIDLVIVDLHGEDAAIEETLRYSAISPESFRSAKVLSPFLKSVPEGLEFIQVEGPFRIYAALDDLPSAEGHLLMLEAGCALMHMPEPTDGLVALRSAGLESGQRSPVWQRDQQPRHVLLPQQPGGLLMPHSLFASRNGLFQTFQHLTPWHLLLEAVETNTLTQPEEVSLIQPEREVFLSALHRRWLEEHQPEMLIELRSPQEEWDILRHDLILAIVNAHAGLFRAQAAWLNATQLTGITR